MTKKIKRTSQKKKGEIIGKHQLLKVLFLALPIAVVVVLVYFTFHTTSNHKMSNGSSSFPVYRLFDSFLHLAGVSLFFALSEFRAFLAAEFRTLYSLF